MNRSKPLDIVSESTRQIETLRDAARAIIEAPEIGFLDLDRLKTSLESSAVVFESLLADFDLGRRLLAETRESIKAKIKAIESVFPESLDFGSNGAIDFEKLDYERLNALREKIDRLFERIFGGSADSHFKGRNIEISEFK